MKEKGDPDSAKALIKLTDLINSSELSDNEKQEFKGLVEALAEEAQRPEPRKANLKALGAQLSVGIASSMIATEAQPLVDLVSHLWSQR